MPFLKVLGERVANEILMYFRSQKKSSQDVSLSDYIETGNDGAALSLMDVVAQDEDLLERISNPICRRFNGNNDSKGIGYFNVGNYC